MKLQVAKNLVTSKVARQILITKKNSPVVLFTAGTLGMVGSTILACRATLKVGAILDEHDEMAQTIDDVNLNPKFNDKYTDRDAAKDRYLLKVQTAAKIGKLYAPALGLGLISVAALTGSHVVLSRRNTALMAAYAALNRGFEEYHERVRDEFGIEKDKEFRMNGQTVDLHDTQTGKKFKGSFSGLDGKRSMYARLWSRETSRTYQSVPEYNLVYLTAQQNFLNDKLTARGHVLLNDAYDAIGLERSKEGCVVGWVKGHGDDYIDFGIFREGQTEAVYNFVTGQEGGIWLDFNVDGVIYDII